MYSDAPICRLVAPSATSASTCRSRAVRPNGSSPASSDPAPARSPRRPRRSSPPSSSRARWASVTSSSSSHRAPEPPRIRQRRAGRLARRVAVAGLAVRLGRAPQRVRAHVRPRQRLPFARRLHPQRGVALSAGARELGRPDRSPGDLDRPALLRGRAQPLHVDPRPGDRVALVGLSRAGRGPARRCPPRSASPRRSRGRFASRRRCTAPSGRAHGSRPRGRPRGRAGAGEARPAASRTRRSTAARTISPPAARAPRGTRPPSSSSPTPSAWSASRR